MTPPVRLTPAAVQDVILAERWYLEEAPHVVASFRQEIDKTLRRISEQPASYQTVEAAVRRAPMRKFPFSLFYRVLPAWIEVVAVLHQSRDPRTWRQRI